MTYGASALARTANGQVVFVDDALPGERVIAAVGKRKRRYLQARVEEVLQPSPRRVPPPCPYVPACGGCQWQHGEYEAQVEMKARVLAETLRRAGVSAPEATIIPSDQPMRYRIRGEFHIIPPTKQGGFELGFNRRRTYDVVAVDDCLIHHPNVAEALPGIRRALDRAGAGTARSLRLTGHPERRELLWQALGGAAPDGLQDALTTELPDYLVHQDSLSLEYDASRIDGRPGPPVVFRVDSGAFVQVNHGLAHRLYSAALGYLGDRPGQLLEGYAGFGAMSVLAATRPELTARPTRLTLIEEGRPAVVLARLHIRLHEVEHATILPGRLEDRLAQVEPEEVDSVIIDPPRAGMTPAVIDELARLAPERIVYLSCDPATLARDLASLADDGYAVQAQALVDMFPQTYHIETVSLLQRHGNVAG
ncbi:MAG: TRAM domain-containing protein [Candidatus Dormibacteraeota bacterium]|nr:TRAM domain-containing protein [Candidatus Dormibacteraeota bacterium]